MRCKKHRIATTTAKTIPQIAVVFLYNFFVIHSPLRISSKSMVSSLPKAVSSATNDEGNPGGRWILDKISFSVFKRMAAATPYSLATVSNLAVNSRSALCDDCRGEYHGGGLEWGEKERMLSVLSIGRPQL